MQDTEFRSMDYAEWIERIKKTTAVADEDMELTEGLELEYTERRSSGAISSRNSDIEEYYAWRKGSKIKPPPISGRMNKGRFVHY